MEMRNSSLSTAIGHGRPVIGCAHAVRDETVSETLRDVDLDFLLIDMQHVAVTVETLQRLLTALQPTSLSVLVRPLCNDQAVIGQVIDAGADGVIVPMVNTAEQARSAVAAAKFPPTGVRSWGPRRAAALFGGAKAYAQGANDNTMVFTQVETAEAVGNLDEILSVPGLNGVIVGPADIAISLGYLDVDQRNDPVVIKTIQQVLDKCLQHKIPFGFIAPSIDSAVHWLDRGALVVSCMSDTSFITQGVNLVSAALTAARTTARDGGGDALSSDVTPS